MQKLVRTGIALSALLAWSIAVAQNTMQPTQVAAEGTTTTTTAPAPEVVPVGTEGTILGVSTTTAAIGGGAVLLGGAIIASQDDDTTPSTGTTGTR